MLKYKYKINDIEFNSQKDIIKYIQDNIYNKYKDYECMDEKDFIFIMDLLSNHPNYIQKKGVGIKKIWLQMNYPYSNRSFWIERNDKTRSDFSYYKCIFPQSQLKDRYANKRR